MEKSKNEFFSTKEDYIAFRTLWSKHAATKTITPAQLVLYSILRGKDPARGFKPITNENKIKDGTQPWRAFNHCTVALKFYLNRTDGPELEKALKHVAWFHPFEKILKVVEIRNKVITHLGTLLT